MLRSVEQKPRPSGLKRVAQVVGATVLAAGMLAVGLVNLGPTKVKAQARLAPWKDPHASYFGRGVMPRYPEARQVFLGDRMAVNGQNVKASHFMTRDPVAKVLGFYRSIWENAGHKVFGLRSPDGSLGTVGIFDFDRRMLRNVSAVRGRTGTMVVLSLAGMEGPKVHGTAGPDPEVPAMRGSAGFFSMRSVDLGRAVRTVTYFNAARPADNVRYMGRALAKMGWRRTSRISRHQGSRVFEVTRRGSTMTVTIGTARGGKGSSVVALVREASRGTPGEGRGR